MTKLDLVRAKCALLPVMFLTIAHVQRSRTQGPQSPHSNLGYRGGVSGYTSFWPAPGVF